MAMDSDCEGNKSSSPEEKNPKRRMKTPFQLEALERVYAEDRYPTEAVRAELSIHLNLSDKQLQMWFCHRRLKDRKGKEEEVPFGHKQQQQQQSVDFRNLATALASDVADTVGRDLNDGENDDLKFEHGHNGDVVRSSARAYRRKGGGQETETMPRKRDQALAGRGFDSRMSAESIAVARVESQLGGPLREDGPPLGVEFDPVPPGVFATFAERKSEQMVSNALQRLHKEPRAQVHQETLAGNACGLPPLPMSGMKRKAVDGSGQQNATQQLRRAPREFQFLPEQPSTSGDFNFRQMELNLNQNSDRSYDMIPSSRVCSLSPLGAFLPTNMRLSLRDEYGFQQGKVQNVVPGPLSQEESRVTRLFDANVGMDESQQKGSLYHSFELGQRQSAVQLMTAGQQFVPNEYLDLFQEHEDARVEKKRKNEELKVAKESEAQVKRIKRDLERQEIVKRKKEEQMRRELEKQDRDKRKEEERAVRERQREEREQKREIERQEKMVLKERSRMEKQRLKDEMRQAKEAAKLKAAAERAAAKRVSKETIDTVEDEQLELLEAAAGENLFSINGLKDEEAQMIDFSKVLLAQFPPASVRMKAPLSVPPWNELEHTVGHLFMVWRFLITFSDVIGLWPFTLDEFVQALHEFDSRLLGEIHVTLIKQMVKNIEDAAAASGAVGSQNAITLASGGHPQIVEGAYEWGFNIQEWGQHVGPLTWPEILRQFALAAGYGPKWRKCNKEAPQLAEDAEEHAEENAVTILRSGAAAASAVALMQGKGVGHLRRSRHRLTPGTVKFAAFHVLSLEGSKGLTILEVADKIQKSGLRDLTTSKTPEASIAAALSRDTNLFERVAPSTYCVRPVFRKDLEDTEEVLQSARERIRLFQIGLLEEEEAEKETDEAEERDEDYDSDGQYVLDGDGGAVYPKESDVKDGVHAEKKLNFDPVAEEETEIDESQLGEPWVQGLMEGEYSDLSVEERLMALVALVNVVNEGNSIRLALETRMDSASAFKRQMWAEAQIERRRHKEEQSSRLQSNAAKNEGDLIGSVPVNTGEKKPKSSECTPKSKNETNAEPDAMPDESSPVPQSLSLSDPVLSSQEKSIAIFEKSIALPDGPVSRETVIAPGQVVERSNAQVKADIGICAEELYVVRSLPLGLDRRRNRYWQFVTCTGGGRDPSQGRIFFESSSDGHWEVIDTEEALDALMMSLDIRGTREAALHTALVRLECSVRQAMRSALYSGVSGKEATSGSSEAETALDVVQGDDGSGVLDCMTVDTRSLNGLGLNSLESSAIVVEVGKTDTEKYRLFERFRDFEQWIWNENSRTLTASRVSRIGKRREPDLLLPCGKCHELYWTTDKHCQFCHSLLPKSQSKQDFLARDFEDKGTKKYPSWKFPGPVSAVPPRIQMLKAAVVSIEVVVPSEALKDHWDHQRRKAWASSLKGAVTPAELLQSLTELEGRVQRDWLSSLYDTTEEVLSAGKGTNLCATSQIAPWVPHTSAAVGLRVMAFDGALAYSSEEKKRWQKQDEGQNNMNIGVPASRATPELTAADSRAIEEDNGDNSGDVAVVGGSGRGRGRGRGGRRSQGNHSGKTAATTNVKVAGVKKGSRNKLQVGEEGAIAVQTDAMQGGKGRGQGRGRGRPRGRGTVQQGRGRGSRGGSHKQRQPKEKNPNELMTEAATVQKAAVEESEVAEEDSESDGDTCSKGEWEESEDQSENHQEIGDEEDNTNAMVGDDREKEEPQEEEVDDVQGKEDVEESESSDEDEDRLYDSDGQNVDGEGQDLQESAGHDEWGRFAGESEDED